jgi:hypothetical protein
MIWDPVTEEFIQDPFPTHWRSRGEFSSLSMKTAGSTRSRDSMMRPPLSAIGNLRQRVWRRPRSHGPNSPGEGNVGESDPSNRGMLRAALENGHTPAFVLSIALRATSAACADR